MEMYNVLLMAGGGSQQGGGLQQFFLLFIILIVIIIAVKTSKKEEDIPTTADQTNKVVNVPLTGGIIGILASSPQSTLNKRIQLENAKGWKVVQIIPADTGNMFLLFFRLILLLITLFLFTMVNGYYIILEKK